MADWSKIKSRGSVDDRRAFSGRRVGLGLGGVAIVAALTFLSGGNVSDVIPVLVNELQTTGEPTQNAAQFQGEDAYEVFASTVLGSTNDLWSQKFSEENKTYTPPELVLFRNGTESGCGGATSDIGPHYCPRDTTIYLDETFFDELTSRFGARGGDVAQAYVLAHEVGHHVQNLFGTSDQADRIGTNEASIALELQADCFAGIWANSVEDQGVFETGEIEEAIDAAAAVGDDRIQQKVDGRITPETWTHGSSAERVRWFTLGYENGLVEGCNTFAIR